MSYVCRIHIRVVHSFRYSTSAQRRKQDSRNGLRFASSYSVQGLMDYFQGTYELEGRSDIPSRQVATRGSNIGTGDVQAPCYTTSLDLAGRPAIDSSCVASSSCASETLMLLPKYVEHCRLARE
jgi:hypothetical protein